MISTIGFLGMLLIVTGAAGSFVLMTEPNRGPESRNADRYLRAFLILTGASVAIRYRNAYSRPLARRRTPWLSLSYLVSWVPSAPLCAASTRYNAGVLCRH